MEIKRRRVSIKLMRLFFIIASFISISFVESQYIPPKIISEHEIDYSLKDTLDNEDVFNVCIFPEETLVDIEKWKKYLMTSLVLDSASMDTIPAGTYTVIVDFSIGEKGRLSNVSVVKDPGYGLGKRVIEVLLTCEGIWKPAMYKGRPILNYRRQPITFIVEEECKELPANITL